MTDKIPSFKKEIDKIHIPIEKLNTIISETAQKEMPKRKGSIRTRLLYSGTAAVVAMGLVVGSGFVSPAMASIVSKIPIIGSIFSESGDKGLKQVSDLGLTKSVGESKTVGDKTITIDEVFYDGTRFDLSFSLESEKPLDESYLGSGPDFTVNGKYISSAGLYGEDEITPNLITGILNIDAITDLPKEFEMDLHFKGRDGKEWTFKLPVKEQTDTKLVEVNHNQYVDGMDLTITSMKVGPAGILINFNALSEDKEHLASYIEFKAVDALGNTIPSHSGGSMGKETKGKEYTIGNRLLDPVDERVKELTITPYLELPTDGGGVTVDTDGNETPNKFVPIHKNIKFESFKVRLP